MTRESTAIIPRERVAQLEGWENLAAQEQNFVYREAKALAEEMVRSGISRLAIGEHLSNLREVLEPQRMFLRFLATFNFTQRTAYRYMEAHYNARKFLPDNILRAAMTFGFDFGRPSESHPLGMYTEFVKKNSPPKTDDPAKIEEYARKLVAGKKQAMKRPLVIDADPTYDRDEALKECYRFAVARLRKLPKNSRSRANFVRDLAGILLSELDINTPVTVEPIPVPEGFPVVRGRPVGTTNEAKRAS